MNLKNKWQLVLLILIVMTVAFIFTQSIIPPETSSAESEVVSDVVTDVVVDIIGDDTPEKVEKAERASKYIDENMRKIAHVVEFAVLGAEVAVLGFLIEREKAKSSKSISLLSVAAASLIFGLLIAFLDESIQILSGRGPLVSDIWIDLSGYTSLLVVTHLVILVIRKQKMRY